MFSKNLAPLIICVGIAFGCNGKSSAPPDPKTRLSGVTLRVLVTESEPLQGWLEDIRGEWTAQTGAKVDVTSVSISDIVSPQGSIPGSALAAPAATSGEILIFPTTEMANVVAAGLATKVPAELLESSDYEFRDVAAGVRSQLIAWDRLPHALPVSAHCTIVYYRVDLYASEMHRTTYEQKFGHPLEPPRTWDDLDRQVQYFADQDLDGDGATDHGMAIASYAEALLSRAAALGKAPQNFSFLFDVNSMEPLVTGPAFQESVRQWLAVRHGVAEPGSDGSPLAVFSSGKAAMAIGSSSLAHQWLRSDTRSEGNRVMGKVGCVPLPGSTRLFLHDKQHWADQPVQSPNRTSLLDGIAVSVPKNSQHAAAAYELLAFLTNRERTQLYVTMPAYRMSPYRLSHLVDTAVWTANGWTAGGSSSFVSTLRETLNQSNAVARLRIDSSPAYYEALEREMSTAWASGSTGLAALEAVAESWRKISLDRGVDRQRRNYRYSLGMPVLN